MDVLDEITLVKWDLRNIVFQWDVRVKKMDDLRLENKLDTFNFSHVQSIKKDVLLSGLSIV